MHKYLRAIGFSQIRTQKQLKELIKRAIREATDSRFALYEDEIMYADYSLDVSEDFGLRVCGEFDDEDEFNFEFCYPYMKTSISASNEKSVIERNSATVSYSGLCEDNKIGISIIYFLQNRIDYINHGIESTEKATGKAVPVCLSGLALSGTIMMPIVKNKENNKKSSKRIEKRDKLIEAARNGSGDALESLAFDDLDMYSTLSRKIKESDVYTLVDTYFMPFGVECDKYSVLGTIEDVILEKNNITDEEIYVMQIICNGLPIDVCINKEDLLGEPCVGRRFKGTIWLQGYLDTAMLS